jgi:hypothetical protein
MPCVRSVEMLATENCCCAAKNARVLSDIGTHLVHLTIAP